MLSEVGQNDAVAKKKEDKEKQTLYLSRRNLRRMALMEDRTGAKPSWTTDKALDEYFERLGIEDPGPDPPPSQEDTRA